VPTTLATLIQRTRRFLGDYNEFDVTTASVATAVVTTITVADTSIYAPNWTIQIDQEAMRVRALTNATTLTVLRGANGTTAATHTTAATILARPAFLDQQIIDAVNAGINATFPYYYKKAYDTSLTADGTTYEFTVPNMPSTTVPIPWLDYVELKVPGDLTYRKVDDWTVRRGGTPILKFRSFPWTGTLRVHGYGPFPNLAAVTDSLDSLFPGWGEDVLVEYAAQRLLMAGEAQRVRQAAGPLDNRESSNRTGSSSATAGQILQRFQMRLQQAPMPPVPRHCVRTF
jgi:hypothetical protein